MIIQKQLMEHVATGLFFIIQYENDVRSIKLVEGFSRDYAEMSVYNMICRYVDDLGEKISGLLLDEINITEYFLAQLEFTTGYGDKIIACCQLNNYHTLHIVMYM